ncbi:hypothetical protein J6590_056965 [Homalodisca vitripennis]|nr:hypothetical protein J6590_056965 [Homalodisca vitripennis]
MVSFAPRGVGRGPYQAGPKRQKESTLGESIDALTRLSNCIGIFRAKPLSQVVTSGIGPCKQLAISHLTFHRHLDTPSCSLREVPGIVLGVAQ